MKKTLWMLGAAVAALTSCTQSEVVEIPEGRVIGFESFVNKETKAVSTIAATNELTHFYVFGANTAVQDPPANYSTADYTPLYSEAEIVGPAWTHSKSSDECAWANNRLYRFAAYTNGNTKCATGVASFDPQEQKLIFTDYEVGDKDLIACVTADRETGQDVSSESKVALNFHHMLSRIKFTFHNESTTNRIRIEDITLSIYNTSTGTIDKDAAIIWNEGANDRTNKTFEGATVEVKSQSGDSYQIEHYVIPQSSVVNVNITYRTLAADGGVLHTNGSGAGEEVSLAINTNEPWKPGYAYNYTAGLTSSTKKIQFFVETISNWQNISPDLNVE